MTTEHNIRSAEDQFYLGLASMSAGVYNSMPSELSASVPPNCSGYDNIYSGNANNHVQYLYPVKDAASVAAMGVIPVELNVESLYEDLDRRRRKSGNEKIVAPQLQRRRAQNRASQQAFREKKKKYIQDLEEKLTGLQGQHSALAQLYESLQLAYLSVKEELETIRRRNSNQEDEPPGMRSHHISAKEWEESHMEMSNPLLFNVSLLYSD